MAFLPLALVRLVPGYCRLLCRRSLPDPSKIAYYASHGPWRAVTVTLAAVAGSRWQIEECFQQANVSVAHCAFFSSGVLERSSLGGFYLETQAAASSTADVHGGEFAALDLMQNGLPGDAEGGGGLPQW